MNMNNAVKAALCRIKTGSCFIILLSVLVLHIPMYATSLCDDNKTWLYQANGNWENNAATALYEAQFVGSVVKNGHEYKELRIVRSVMQPGANCQRFSDDQLKSNWFFRQDGDKVWFDRWGEDILVYDFAIANKTPFPGQQEYLPLDEFGETVALILPDTLTGGISRRCYTAASPEGKIYNPDFRCIEGIGATDGFLCSFYIFQYYGVHLPDEISPDNPGNFPTLIGVKDKRLGVIYGEEELFQNFESLYSGIGNIMADDNAAPVYYNLQGQRIAAPQKGQPCIERQGGKARKTMPK